VAAGAAASNPAAALAATPVLGLIVPPTASAIPPEGPTLYGKEMGFRVKGLGLKMMTPEGYDSVIDGIVPAGLEMARDGAQALSIHGTSLTFYKGAAFNQKLIDDVRKATGLPTTSMSTAVIEGLKVAKAKRIAVATAYNEEVTRRLGVFLGEHGFEVLALKGLGIEIISGPSQVSPASLQQFCAGVFNSAKGADALLVSCGGLSTLDIIAPLESPCAVPVVSSTPHAFWAGMRTAGLHVKRTGYGQVIAAG
jgi:arylmalonate decarboxylase